MKKAIQFGAGNIGRGFIGGLLSRSGYEVLFADISPVLIPELMSRKEYIIEIVGENREELRVAPVDGCFSDDDRLLDAIADAEIITTAVGPNVLKHIAPRIAAGLKRRLENKNETPLNIIACENLVHASAILREEVEKNADAETIGFLKGHAGFPDCAVDRIIPPMEESDDPLRVRVEEFSEWIVDRTGFIGTIPEIEGMQLTDTLLAFVQRKLFTLNTGHAITAYLGAVYELGTVAESIADEKILTIVRGAMQESGEVLIRRFDFDRDAHYAYIEKILKRFRNPWLNDDVRRVGRQPMRKLSFDDRLIKPLRGTLEYGLPNRNLILGIVAALSFRNEDDEQAKQMRELLEGGDLRAALVRITSLEDDEILSAIEIAYRNRPKPAR
jgi:mannitol-1-phosphate 5-dehydrogenase